MNNSSAISTPPLGIPDANEANANTSGTDSKSQHIVGDNPLDKNQLYTVTDNMSMCTKCSRLFSNAEILHKRLQLQPRSHYIRTKLHSVQAQLRPLMCQHCEPVVVN